MIQKTLSFCNVINRHKFEFKKLMEDEHILKKGAKDKEMFTPCIPYQPLFPIQNIFKLENNELLLKPPQKLCIKNIDSEEDEIQRLKDEIENLKIENDALKSVSRKWSYWFKDVCTAVDNFPSVEEIDSNVDVNNCLMTLLVELQKNLIKARRRLRLYKKKSERLEKILNTDCSKTSKDAKCSNTSELCSCEQIESETSCRCSSLSVVKTDVCSCEIKSEISCPRSTGVAKISDVCSSEIKSEISSRPHSSTSVAKISGEVCSSEIKSEISCPRSSTSVAKISEPQVQRKEELVKFKLFKKSKDKGYLYKDYVKIKIDKLESKINKIEGKEKKLKSELKENREKFNRIQVDIEVLREKGGTEEQFRTRMIEQKHLAKLISKIDKVLQECSHWKQKYLDSVLFLKKSVKN